MYIQKTGPLPDKARLKPMDAKRQSIFAPWQFVSQGRDVATHLFYIQLALEAGCRWIQLRLKNQEVGDIVQAGKVARQLCDQYQAVFILNDYVELAGQLRADGVHLGLNDLPIGAARQLLGKGYLIGGTANTVDQVRQRINQQVDYIGLGPFRFTQTKKGLSPVLGLSGYQQVLTALRSDKQSGGQITDLPPVYAIGGINPADLAAIFNTQVSGVAISGWLTRQLDLAKIPMRFDRALNYDNVATFFKAWKTAYPKNSEAILAVIRQFDYQVNRLSAQSITRKTSSQAAK